MAERRAVADSVALELASIPADTLRRGIVAAVSGGADSTALALVLSELRLRDELTGPLFVAHVDHRVRNGSADDAEAVRRLAAQLDLRFVLHRLDAPSHVSEQSLRDARYAALTDTVRATGAGVLATAHHRDDVIETVLFRLRRGTGLRGMAGIPALRQLSSDGALVARPLLQQDRSALLAICAANGIEPRHDPTNDDLRFARNHLRHQIVPALRARHGDEADRLLLHAAQIARATTEAFESRARVFLANHADRMDDGSRQLRLEQAIDEPTLAEALRILHIELGATAPTRHWLARAVALRNGPSGRSVAGRGATVTVRRTRTGLSIHGPRSVASRPAAMHTFRPAGANPSRDPAR